MHDVPQWRFEDDDRKELWFAIKHSTTVDTLNDCFLSKFFYGAVDHDKVFDHLLLPRTLGAGMDCLFDTMNKCDKCIMRCCCDTLETYCGDFGKVVGRLNLREKYCESASKDKGDSTVHRFLTVPLRRLFQYLNRLCFTVERVKDGSLVVYLSANTDSSWEKLKQKCKSGEIVELLDTLDTDDQIRKICFEEGVCVRITIHSVKGKSAWPKAILRIDSIAQDQSVGDGTETNPIKHNMDILCEELEICDSLIEELKEQNLVRDDIRELLEGQHTRASKIRYLMENICPPEKGFKVLQDYIKRCNTYLFEQLEITSEEYRNTEVFFTCEAQLAPYTAGSNLTRFKWVAKGMRFYDAEQEDDDQFEDKELTMNVEMGDDDQFEDKELTMNVEMGDDDQFEDKELTMNVEMGDDYQFEDKELTMNVEMGECGDEHGKLSYTGSPEVMKLAKDSPLDETVSTVPKRMAPADAADDGNVFKGDGLSDNFPSALGRIGRDISQLKSTKMTPLNMKMADDKETCNIFGMAVTSNNLLLLTDWYNEKVKVVSPDNKLLSSLALSGKPYDIAVIDDSTAVVSTTDEKLHILDISDAGSLAIQTSVSLGYWALSVAPCNNNLVVIKRTEPRCVKMITMTGAELWSVSTDHNDQELFEEPCSITTTTINDKLTVVVTDWGKDTITLLDANNGDIIKIVDVKRKEPFGLTVANDGNVYVCCWRTREICVWSADFSQSRILLSGSDLQPDVQDIVYCDNTDEILISYREVDIVDRFKLS